MAAMLAGPPTLLSPLQQVVAATPDTLAEFAWLVMPRVVGAVVAILVTLLAIRIVRRWLASEMAGRRVEASTLILVRRTASISILLVGIVVVLGIFDISPAALITVVGAVGLAFSLAVQDILKNFFSGIYLLLERPFRVGDIIKVKDQEGRVELIGVRTTGLRTKENVQVLIPNAVVFAEVVSNHTYARPVAEVSATAATESSAEKSAAATR